MIYCIWAVIYLLPWLLLGDPKIRMWFLSRGLQNANTLRNISKQTTLPDENILVTKVKMVSLILVFNSNFHSCALYEIKLQYQFHLWTSWVNNRCGKLEDFLWCTSYVNRALSLEWCEKYYH